MKVYVGPRAEKQIKRIMKGDRSSAEKILDAIDALQDDPYPVGSKAVMHGFRKRVGRYRIFYRVRDARGMVGVGGVRLRGEGTYPDEALIDFDRADDVLDNIE